jgi:hypothetical protein
MWKKLVGGLAGCLLLARWSRRFVLAWRVAAGSGGHLRITAAALGMYFAASIALLVFFWNTEGRWTKIAAIAFVALQFASIQALVSAA